MLDALPQGTLPDLMPELLESSDVARFENLWDAALNVDFKCCQRDGRAGWSWKGMLLLYRFRNSFFRVKYECLSLLTVVVLIGKADSIGILVVAKGSDLDKAVMSGSGPETSTQLSGLSLSDDLQ